MLTPRQNVKMNRRRNFLCQQKIRNENASEPYSQLGFFHWPPKSCKAPYISCQRLSRANLQVNDQIYHKLNKFYFLPKAFKNKFSCERSIEYTVATEKIYKEEHLCKS